MTRMKGHAKSTPNDSGRGVFYHRSGVLVERNFQRLRKTTILATSAQILLSLCLFGISLCLHLNSTRDSQREDDAGGAGNLTSSKGGDVGVKFGGRGQISSVTADNSSIEMPSSSPFDVEAMSDIKNTMTMGNETKAVKEKVNTRRKKPATKGNEK